MNWKYNYTKLIQGNKFVCFVFQQLDRSNMYRAVFIYLFIYYSFGTLVQNHGFVGHSFLEG